MKNKVLSVLMVAFFSVVCLFGAGSGLAATASIAVIDIQKVVAESRSGRAAQGEMEKKMADLKAKFKKEEDTLLALQEEIEKKGTAWSEEKKREKMRDYQKLGRELQDKNNDANYELNQVRKEKLEPILNALKEVVEKIGKRNGYGVILESNAGVLYFEKSIDITDEAIKGLNEAMK